MEQAMEVVKQNGAASEIEKVLIGGDLSRLSPEQRVDYMRAVCRSLGLNPLTQPFAYITLNGKLTLYAKKDCTEQLRTIHGISITLPSREVLDGVYVVTATAKRSDGRCDEATGAVAIEGLKGEARANAYMKAETKSKRRVTLSICGLGMLDESELESIPNAGSTEQAQAVAQKRIAELKALVRPEEEHTPEVPEAVQKIFNKMGSNREGIKQALAGIYADLQEVAGNEQGRMIFDDISKRFGVGDPASKVRYARAVIQEAWKVIEHMRNADQQAELDLPVEPELVGYGVD